MPLLKTGRSGISAVREAVTHLISESKLLTLLVSVLLDPGD